MRLDGLNCVITGGSSGIGAATAKRFVAEGAQGAQFGGEVDRSRLPAQLVLKRRDETDAAGQASGVFVCAKQRRTSSIECQLLTRLLTLSRPGQGRLPSWFIRAWPAPVSGAD